MPGSVVVTQRGFTQVITLTTRSGSVGVCLFTIWPP